MSPLDDMAAPFAASLAVITAGLVAVVSIAGRLRAVAWRRGYRAGWRQAHAEQLHAHDHVTSLDAYRREGHR